MSIKISQHSISFSNKKKLDNLSIFIDEYRRVASIILDNIWSNGYILEDQEFNISKNKLQFPKYIDYNRFELDTILTARALSSLGTQLAGMISSSTEKQRKRLYILEQKKNEGIPRKQRRLLINKVKQNIPQKPDCSRLNPELSSKCIDWKETEGEFNGFIRLKSIFKDRTEIKIPIKFHRQSKKLKSIGTMKTSFLVSNNHIDIRWEIEDKPKKTEGITVGADQGFKDVLTCSDKQSTPKTDPHGHSLESILGQMTRARKGSKRFKRLQDHRKNFINYSLNRINLSGIKQLNLENIWNIGYKNKTSRRLSHWTNTLIRDKVEDLCLTEGVSLVFQSSTYRSQRCSSCGLVRKSNRKGKNYSCKECGLEVDADFNASLNHEQVLPEIPYEVRKLNLNRKGFYWLENGLFDLTGTSLQSVPPVEVKKYI